MDVSLDAVRHTKFPAGATFLAARGSQRLDARTKSHAASARLGPGNSDFLQLLDAPGILRPPVAAGSRLAHRNLACERGRIPTGEPRAKARAGMFRNFARCRRSGIRGYH